MYTRATFKNHEQNDRTKRLATLVPALPYSVENVKPQTGFVSTQVSNHRKAYSSDAAKTKKKNASESSRPATPASTKSENEPKPGSLGDNTLCSYTSTQGPKHGTVTRSEWPIPKQEIIIQILLDIIENQNLTHAIQQP